MAASASDGDQTILHASCVALDGRGLLITGASGSGKSALALALMGLGCALVADDRVILRRDGDRVIADAPETIAGMIEARGIGILNARPAGPAPLALVADLDTNGGARLPERRRITLLGAALPLLPLKDAPHPAPALMQLLKAGFRDGI